MTQPQPQRLNQRTSSEYTHSKLTDEQITELAEWFAHLSTNDDPDKVMPVPYFYRPTAAYMQMQGIDLVDGCHDANLKPWNMPAPLVDFYADVWLANRRGVLTAMQAQKHHALQQAAGQHNEGGIDSYLFGGGKGKEPGRA